MYFSTYQGRGRKGGGERRRRGGGGRRKRRRARNFTPANSFHRTLFPRKKFLFSTPGLFMFSKCALSPPLSQ
jgi:hypothetical protein